MLEEINHTIVQRSENLDEQIESGEPIAAELALGSNFIWGLKKKSED